MVNQIHTVHEKYYKYILNMNNLRGLPQFYIITICCGNAKTLDEIRNGSDIDNIFGMLNYNHKVEPIKYKPTKW